MSPSHDSRQHPSSRHQIDRLIARSSLGSPEAVRMRKLTSSTRARAIIHRVNQNNSRPD